MRILHIIPSLRTGGAERLVLDMCRELKRQGHEVKLVKFQDKNDYEYLSREVDLQFLPVYVHPSLLGKWEVNIEPLNRLIKEFMPAVIHSHLFEAEILSRKNIHSGIKYFSHCHDNMPQLRNFSAETLLAKRRFTDFYEKQHLVKKYFDCHNRFIAISNDTKQYIEGVLPGELRKNIFLLNNAIDFKRFNSVNHERATDVIRIVNAGSFVAKKNQQLLVDIVKELVAQKKDVKLVMLGEGPLLRDVEKKINDYGLKDFIECKGNVERVEDYFAEANVYAHTATYEPFGLVLLEAMAAGLPVISLDGNGNRDIMNSYEDGFMIRNADAKEFVTKINQLYHTPGLYNKVAERSISTSKQYDIPEYTRKLIELYQQA